MTINYETFLEFTEIKNGHATGKTFINTAGAYIDAVRSADDGSSGIFPQLIGIGEADEDGDYAEYHDPFNDLTVEDQLELCIERNNDSYASRTTYKIAA
ncbi:MAG: hypothetical protein CV087_08730 [Candidatus Brocadia sp. WS118]|nr:MAG: hypothetical protein CV087_08730 [Candidatus Brocadia sp. WS118]